MEIRSRFDGKSALHVAAAGEESAVRFLLQAGADAGALDRAGQTPLHKAAAVGDTHTEVAKVLLDAADNVRRRDHSRDGDIGGGRDGLLRAVDGRGETALDTAVREQRRTRRRTHA